MLYLVFGQEETQNIVYLVLKYILKKSKKVSQVIISVCKEHSRKPNEVRDKIIQLVGDLPRIELFVRQKFDGWDC